MVSCGELGAGRIDPRNERFGEPGMPFHDDYSLNGKFFPEWKSWGNRGAIGAKVRARSLQKCTGRGPYVGLAG